MIHRLLEYAVAAQSDKADAVTDLNTVLADAYEDVRLAAEESGAHLTSELLPVVRGDGQRLRLVFMNLLANAIKYRGSDAPEIRVSTHNVENEWVISVQDNGIGIDSRYADKIFELFERLHNSKQYEGSGVGLALCRTIVQQHGGRIWVESEVGRGSTFCFTVPGFPDVAPTALASREAAVTSSQYLKKQPTLDC
jgi:signal transduction histidine kinase